MGRKTEYFCDDCGKTFGDNPHINIKNGDVRISYINQSMPGGARWLQKKFIMQCREYHFCDGVCLGRYFMRLFDTMLKKVTTPEENNDCRREPC